VPILIFSGGPGEEERKLGTLIHHQAREIERLTLSSEFGEYKIPKLEEVFHRYGRAMRYVVEVKVSPGTNAATMARRVSRVAAAYRVTDRCLVASFDAEFLRKLREANPDMAASFLFDRSASEASRPTPLFPPVDAIGRGRISWRPP
jgi:glycerophosphoryl diester phosphodiesterase